MAYKSLNQRTQLIDQLEKDELECLICCCIIRRDVAIWSCNLCYTIFHLYCIKKWANSNFKSDKRIWYCPTCNFCNEKIPNSYTCFCEKICNPPINRSVLPHSCGDQCLKFRSRYNKLCKHPCTEPCHPGPCPPCQVVVDVPCLCGRISRKQQCSAGFLSWGCGEKCLKDLDCGLHKCEQSCHSGVCESCNKLLDMTCYCHSTPRSERCSEFANLVSKDPDGMFRYACESICNQTLSCGLHRCERKCHVGKCAELCPWSPDLWMGCFCGKMTNIELKVSRFSCSDPIPSCGGICEKLMLCQHTCQLICHDGKCECNFSTTIVCLCRFKVKKALQCKDLDNQEKRRCQRKCGMRKTCLRHKCQNICCDLQEHVCDLVCKRLLSCGMHNCTMPCHAGECPPCKRASFEDISCRCGRTVIQAPVPCGTRLPRCRHQCTRDHPCGHPITHNCHQEEKCPPCAFLTSKRCMCGNEVVENVQCFMKDVSCGQQCGKLLPCKVHFCTLQCHKGECWPANQPCDKLCIKRRSICGHACCLPCHGSTPCPRSVCSASVTSRCPCGRRERLDVCGVRSGDTFQGEDGAKLEDGTSKPPNWESIVVRLKCDNECERQEKLARMALALKIDQTKLGSGNTESASSNIMEYEYADSLKKLALALGEEFTKSLEAKLHEFVADTIERRCDCNIIRFKSAGWKKRQLVHHLASFYGCSTYEDGAGSNSVNVVLKGQFGRCRYPNKTLSNIVWSAKSQPIPPPVFNTSAQIRPHEPRCNSEASSSGGPTVGSMDKKTFASIFTTRKASPDRKGESSS